MTLREQTQERAGLSEKEVREVRSLIEQCRPVDVNIILEAGEGQQFLCYQGDALTEGKAFLGAMQGTAHAAEFRLRLTDPKGLRASEGKVQLKAVGPDEILSFARRSALSFGSPIDGNYTQFESQVGTARHRFYVASALGSIVGGIRATFSDSETHLTSFHTVPEARRRGYGRDLLLQTCRTLIDEGRQEIFLEVRTDNEAALGLYRSCGFEVIRRYDFYERPVGAGTST